MIELTPVLRFALLLVRPGMLMLLAPAFGGTYAPAQVKVALTGLIAFALLPLAGEVPPPESLPLALVITREIAIGVALALGVRVLIAGAEFAGHIAGRQMGLSYGAVVDPQSGVRNPVLSVLFGNIALMTFLMIDGHHQFLRALRQSYIDLPIGAGAVNPSLPLTVAQMMNAIFTLGIRLVAPIVIVLIVVEIGMALLARSAPMLNLNASAAPVRLIVGLVVLTVMVPAIASVVSATAGPMVRLAAQMAGAFR